MDPASQVPNGQKDRQLPVGVLAAQEMGSGDPGLVARMGVRARLSWDSNTLRLRHAADTRQNLCRRYCLNQERRGPTPQELHGIDRLILRRERPTTPFYPEIYKHETRMMPPAPNRCPDSERSARSTNGSQTVDSASISM